MANSCEVMVVEYSRSPAEAESSFESVAAEWRVWGFRLALKITGCPDAAADALQEALIRAFRCKRRLEQVESPRAWFKKILVRCARDQRPATRVEREDPDVAADPVQSLHIRQVLAKLEPADRAILALSIGEGLSYAEIGTLLDIPEGTVGSRLHHAKAAFRKRWESMR